jgi:hypothetical protein
MGAEGKNYTLAELKKSFQSKKEMYCYLFDTSCIVQGPPADNTPETSFHEVANRPEARIESVRVWTDNYLEDPGCRGSVGFDWVSPSNVNFASAFTFMYRDREWKTVGFDFPPAAIPKTERQKSN